MKKLVIVLVIIVIIIGGVIYYENIINLFSGSLKKEGVSVKIVSKKEYKLPANFDSLSSKEQVKIVHTNNLKYILDSDIKNFMSAFSKEAIEEKGVPFSEYEKAFGELFASEKFRKVKGKSVEEVIDLNNVTIMEAGERKLVTRGTYFICCFGADILIGFPGKDEDFNNLFAEDGFIAYYKKIDGKWKIVRMI